VFASGYVLEDAEVAEEGFASTSRRREHSDLKLGEDRRVVQGDVARIARRPASVLLSYDCNRM
jgi:hypothetical protein